MIRNARTVSSYARLGMSLLVWCAAPLGALGCVVPADSGAETHQIGSELALQPSEPVPADPGPSEPEGVARKPKNCSGTLGCRYAACYDNCIRDSNILYCTDYCECRVYDGKSDWQCQGESRYIDIKW